MTRQTMNISVCRVDLLKLSPGEIEGINHVIASSNAATIFHTLEWNQVLIEYYGLSHVALLASRGQFIAGLHVLYPSNDHIHRSPAIHLNSVYGGPIAVNDDPDILQVLLQESEKISPFAYFQIWTPPRMDAAPFTQSGYSLEEMLTPVLDLSLPESDRWEGMHRDKRNKIRRAQKAGLTLREAGFDELEEYYSMSVDTLTHGGVRSLPFDFLKRAFLSLNSLGRARLYLVEQFHRVVAGTVILFHGATAYGWDIGWRREYATLSPNDFMIWEVSKKAAQDNYKRFDMLRLEKERLPGIAKWKETFGGNVETCYLLRKATSGFRFVNPVRNLLWHPDRVIQKISTMLQDRQK